uniref:No apical meristem-associated C-terminal domain-containing protein n=1 Tax=Oryza brachyantha TaxID=4533 RepID=J3MVZ2_ORYBR
MSKTLDSSGQTYKMTTMDERKMNVDSLKEHWHKTTNKVTLFNGCYCQLRDTCASGRSDSQLMDQAMELYKSQSNGKTFWPRKFTPNLHKNVVPTPQEMPIRTKRSKKAKGVSTKVAQATVEAAEWMKTLVEAKTTQKEEDKQKTAHY